MNKTSYKNILKDLCSSYQDAIDRFVQNSNIEFDKAVELILNSKGHVVVSGIGKSGHVGRKISATLASTGTPSLFLHPAEAIHGDLGMIKSEDVIIFMNNCQTQFTFCHYNYCITNKLIIVHQR